METTPDENHRSRYLSTMLDLTLQAVRALRGTPRLSEMRPDEQGPRIKYRVRCRVCGDGYVTPDTMTLWDAGDTGFGVYEHCGVAQRTGSLTRETLDVLETCGSAVHPSSIRRLTNHDVIDFVAALASTDTPQEELL